MNLNLTNRTAWVGGGSQGIGLAAAHELALLGATVCLVARHEPRLQHAAQALPAPSGQQHTYRVVDYSQPEAVAQAAQAYLQEAGTVHILINNTGGPAAGPLLQADAQAFVKALHMHVVCNQLLAQTFVPGMAAAGYGRIINVISTSVYEPIPYLGVSNTTRGAVASWAKTLANELGPQGITVNNVLPGFTQTARLDSLIASRAKAGNTSPDAIAEGMRQRVPLRRFAEASEVGAAIAWLASPAAAYISGHSLPVDGGRLHKI